MKYSLRDMFRDVIEMARDAGIWQALTVDEKRSLVEYFLQHFDLLMQEAKWRRFSSLTTTLVSGAR